MFTADCLYYASIVPYFPQQAAKAQVPPFDRCSLRSLAGRDHLSGWTGDTWEVPAEIRSSGSRLNQIRSISPLLYSCLVSKSSDLFVYDLHSFPFPPEFASVVNLFVAILELGIEFNGTIFKKPVNLTVHKWHAVLDAVWLRQVCCFGLCLDCHYFLLI